MDKWTLICEGVCCQYQIKMNNKTLGIIIIIFGICVLYSKQEYSWVVSAVSIGIGSGIFFWKDKENNIDK